MLINKYIIFDKKNLTLFNPKSHDILHKYLLPFYKQLHFNFQELKTFIDNNNYEHTTLIYYSQCTITDFNIKLISYLQSCTVLKIKIIIFTFDFWAHAFNSGCVLRNKYIRNVFKSNNYKTICFAKNIEQLNKFHGFDYSKYKKNIIFNNFWSCYDSSFCNFNNNPIYKLLISGTRVLATYKERHFMANLNHKFIDVYNKNQSDLNNNNNNYNLTLNKYFACFSSSVHVQTTNNKTHINTHAILLKTFEILASGSLLVLPHTEIESLKSIGLVHLKNCYFIDFSKNISEQINYIFNNIPLFENIRMCGYNHANEHLTSTQKINELVAILEL